MRHWKGLSLSIVIISILMVWHHKITCKIGLKLEEVLIEGRQRTLKKEVLQAIGMTQNDSIWARSVQDIKDRMEKLPWVKASIVQRRLPSTLMIHLLEKEPLAIWQNQGKKYVIDYEGHLIEKVSPTQFKHLMVITGPQAPMHFPILYMELQILLPMIPIQGAAFTRSQRWDLYLKGGKMIKLPEKNLSIAIKKLIDFWPFLKNMHIIDLRFQDALIVEPENS